MERQVLETQAPTEETTPTPCECGKALSLPLVALVAIVVLVVGGGLGYYLGAQKDSRFQAQIPTSTSESTPETTQPTPSATPTPQPEPDPTADWEGCKNRVIGISLKYPKGWVCDSKEITDVDGMIILTNESLTITLGTLGRGGPCGMGPDVICNKEPFFENDKVRTYIYSDEKGSLEIFGSLSGGAWFSANKKTELVTSEKEQIKQILSTFEFLD